MRGFLLLCFVAVATATSLKTEELRWAVSVTIDAPASDMARPSCKAVTFMPNSNTTLDLSRGESAAVNVTGCSTNGGAKLDSVRCDWRSAEHPQQKIAGWGRFVSSPDWATVTVEFFERRYAPGQWDLVRCEVTNGFGYSSSFEGNLLLTVISANPDLTAPTVERGSLDVQDITIGKWFERSATPTFEFQAVDVGGVGASGATLTLARGADKINVFAVPDRAPADQTNVSMIASVKNFPTDKDPTGTWTLTELKVEDKVGNVRVLTGEELAAAFPVRTITVSDSREVAEPPAVTNVVMAPSTVDLHEAERATFWCNVTVTGNATVVDGVEKVIVHVELQLEGDPTAEPLAFTMLAAEGQFWVAEDGSATTMQARVDISKGDYPAGIYRLNRVLVMDADNNVRQYGGPGNAGAFVVPSLFVALSAVFALFAARLM